MQNIRHFACACSTTTTSSRIRVAEDAEFARTWEAAAAAAATAEEHNTWMPFLINFNGTRMRFVPKFNYKFSNPTKYPQQRI